MHHPPETDEALLSRMQSGDEQGFVTLYRRRQGGIYRFALHMSGSTAVAEDVTQEVFLALIREGCGYDPARGSLSGYLYGIARNLVLRQADRGRFDVGLIGDLDDSAVPELAVVDDPLIDLTRRESMEGLRRAVLALPRRYREVVVLCDLEEVDYAEAAFILGCPIGTVRSRLHRARALLFDKLQVSRTAAADRPSNPPAGEKPSNPPAGEKPSNPLAGEKPSNPLAGEKPSNRLAREKPLKAIRCLV